MRQFLIGLVLLALVAATVYGDEAVASPKKWRTREDAGTAARDKLLNALFADYKVYNYPENSTVKFGISLLNVNFDEAHDLMNSNVWLKYEWTDNRFSWDEQETGISVMRIPSNKVWLPDVTVYNGVSQTMDCFDTNAIIYPNGKVLWIPPCKLSTYCNLTLTQEPYGQQECMMKFGSWTFDGFTMGLDFFGGLKKTDMDDYQGRRFQVTKNEAIREEKFYDCCVEPYLDLQFNLGFTRRQEGAESCART